jgi:ribonuclease HI
MVAAQPHFLLFSRAEVTGPAAGRWHFMLESVEGELVIEAADEEPGQRRERLELLAVVRGLEALDQPSRVTLVTASPHVARGFRSGLDQWRCNRWRWERDGRLVPIRNRDLWQRVDRALRYHQVHCRTWRFDPPHEPNTRASGPNVHGASHSLSGRWTRWGWPALGRRIYQAARPLFSLNMSWPGERGDWSAAG